MKVASLSRTLNGLLLGALLLSMAGCAASADRVGVSKPAVMPASETERLAWALVEAHSAFAKADGPRLAAALHRIDALGGAPSDADAAELGAWRRAARLGPPMRGRPLGPGYRGGRLTPGQSYQIEQVFLSGKRASIAVSASANARLTLRVQDHRDRPVCTEGSTPNHCEWVPIFTHRYRIRIANPGTSPAQYFLVIE